MMVDSIEQYHLIIYPEIPAFDLNLPEACTHSGFMTIHPDYDCIEFGRFCCPGLHIFHEGFHMCMTLLCLKHAFCDPDAFFFQLPCTGALFLLRTKLHG